MEGRLPETVLKGGAGSGVLRPRLVNRGLGRSGARARQSNGLAASSLPARIRRKCRRSGSAAPGRKRHGGAPRGGRPGSRDAPRLASVRSRPRSAADLGSDASRRSAGPLISGPELQLTPRIGREPAEAPANAAESGAKWIRDQPGRRKCAAGTRCAARRRPRSGLFDIVKRERSVAHAEGGLCICAWPLTHIWKPRIAAQAPVSLGCTGGGRPGAKPVRTQLRFRSRYLLGRMVSSKACKFRDHAPAGTTAMTNAESDEKRRTPCHAAARSCASNRQSPGHAGLWTRRATL